MSELRDAAQQVLDRMFGAYKARNGREVGIQGDDGEKCWIVHSDDIETLRRALAAPRHEGGGAVSEAGEVSRHTYIDETKRHFGWTEKGHEWLDAGAPIAREDECNASIPVGMKLWAGGDSAPADWDGGKVLLRSGDYRRYPDEWQHGNTIQGRHWDIIAYTPRHKGGGAVSEAGVKIVASALCRAAGMDPDDNARTGYSWINHTDDARALLAALSSAEPVESAAEAGEPIRAEVERLRAEVRALRNPDLFWVDDDPEAGYNDVSEAIDAAGGYTKRGNVVVIREGMTLGVTHWATLPAADDSDSDDWWEQGFGTADEAEQALKVEIARRAALTASQNGDA